MKMEENMQHFQHIMLYYFKKGKDTTEMHTHKRLEQCLEKMQWLIERVKSGWQSFVLEISRWMILHGQVGQLKLIGIKSSH